MKKNFCITSLLCKLYLKSSNNLRLDIVVIKKISKIFQNLVQSLLSRNQVLQIAVKLFSVELNFVRVLIFRQRFGFAHMSPKEPINFREE